MPPFFSERMRSKMADLKDTIIEGLKKSEDSSINITPLLVTNAINSVNNGVRQSTIEAEYTISEPNTTVPQTKSAIPALKPSSRNMRPTFEPLEMVQEETKVLNVFNSNHTAKTTRARQIKEEEFQYVLRQNYRELSARPIIPLANHPTATGEFPFHILPKKLARDVRRISKATGWDQFSTLVTILGVLSISLWGKFIVRLDDGWDEPVVICLCVLSPSGTMKSFFVKTFKIPLLVFRDEIQETFVASLEVQDTAEAIHGAMKKDQREKIRQIVKAYGSDLDAIFKESQKAIAPTVALKKRLDKIQVGRPTILMDNITSKKIPHVMKGNGGVGNIFESEIGFFKDAVKDKSLGARLFLKGNCMEEFIYATCQKEVHILQAALNMIYVIQPEAVKEFYKDQQLAELGVTPRLDVYFASEPHLNDKNEFDDSVLQGYRDVIIAHLRRNYTQEQPRPISYITVTPEANDAVMGYKRHTHNQTTSGDYKHMASYIRKQHGKAVRWAALVHSYMNEHPESVPISADTMWIGIEIARHLAGHADYAFRSDGLQAYDLAQRILNWIKERGVYEFSPREFQRGPGSKLNVGTIEGALKLLERHNIISIHHKPYGGLHCLVHPQAWRI